MVSAPVLHVNADDPEAVVFCAGLALDFRQQFGKDVVIDLVCYRRHGHNEADEPAATQPLMYQVIRKHKTPRELYAERLVAEGVVDADAAKAIVDTYRDKLDNGKVATELADAKPQDYDLTIDWEPYLTGTVNDAVDTTVKPAKLKALAKRINDIPADVTLHPRVAKIYEDRRKMATGELPATGARREPRLRHPAPGAAACASSARRGPRHFFHRHAVLHDQKSDVDYLPLQQLVKNPEDATIIDSLLRGSGDGVEYGYSTSEPHTLCIWEAQFGDFANGRRW